jgi:hypothetical protein
MTESFHEITKLCETWWGKMADNTKVDQQRFAEQLLSLLGWKGLVPLEPKKRLAQVSCITYILRGGPQTTVAAHFVMPGALEPPATVAQQGLDYCDTTRLIIAEGAPSQADFAFITDLYRSYLYDARSGELLLAANTPAEFRREFGDMRGGSRGVLSKANVDRGALEEVRRQPRSHVARQLRQWCQHWIETLAADQHLPEHLACLAVDRLLVVRFLFEHDILKRSGWRLRQRFSDLANKVFADDTRGCGKLLTSLFHDIWFDWKADIFSAEPAINAVLEKDEVAAPMLREFALHSGNKFGLATILESFNHGDAAEKARVRMVPDENEEREMYLAKQTAATVDEVHVEIDIADEGYKAIFYWLDRLVDLYERLEIDFNAKTFRAAPQPEEMDLFAWSEINAKTPDALSDKFQHALEHGLTVYYSTPRQLRTARLMLYLHLISRYDQSGHKFTAFPKIDSIFKLRPRLLEVDRKWIYTPPTEDEWYM